MTDEISRFELWLEGKIAPGISKLDYSSSTIEAGGFIVARRLEFAGFGIAQVADVAFANAYGYWVDNMTLDQIFILSEIMTRYKYRVIRVPPPIDMRGSSPSSPIKYESLSEEYSGHVISYYATGDQNDASARMIARMSDSLPGIRYWVSSGPNRKGSVMLSYAVNDSMMSGIFIKRYRKWEKQQNGQERA